MVGRKIMKGILKGFTGVLLLNAVGSFALALVGPLYHYFERGSMISDYRKTNYFKEMRVKELDQLNKDFKEKFESFDPSNPDDLFKLDKAKKEYEYYRDLIVYDSHDNFAYSIMKNDKINPEYYQNYNKAGEKGLSYLWGFLIGPVSFAACMGTSCLCDRFDYYEPEEETKEVSDKKTSTKEKSR